MSKIHYFQRYSTPENTVTNNTLQLFARIYNYSASQASILLSGITVVLYSRTSPMKEYARQSRGYSIVTKFIGGG